GTERTKGHNAYEDCDVRKSGGEQGQPGAGELADDGHSLAADPPAPCPMEEPVRKAAASHPPDAIAPQRKARQPSGCFEVGSEPILEICRKPGAEKNVACAAKDLLRTDPGKRRAEQKRAPWYRLVAVRFR